MASVDAFNKNEIFKKIQSLEDSLKCKICSNLLKDPVLIQKCGHSSCKSCFGRHRDNTCPVCHVPVSTRDSLEDKQLKELMLQLLQLKAHLKEVVENTDGALTLSSTPKPGKKRLSSKTPPFTPLSARDGTSQQTPLGRVAKGARKSSPNSPHLNKKNHKGETLLHRMVIKGDISRVRELLDEGAEVNTQDNNGWTPLHEASNHGFLEIASLLLERGALVNVPSAKDLVTPLHDALLNGYQMDMAHLLVSKGADLHAKTSFGYTALDLCRSEDDRRVLSEACSPFIEGNTIAANKVAPSKTDKLVLLSSNLSEVQKQQLQKCASLLKADVVDEYKTEVSHIVTSCDEEGNCMRTMKILLGMLGGKWVMNFQWIEVCLEYKKCVPEEAFEAQGTKNQPNTQGPRRGRQNAEQKFPPLFSGLNFYLHGNFTTPTPCREELRNLIHLGGGRILSREPRPSPPSANEKREIAYHAAGTALEDTPNFILYQEKPPRDTHIHEGGVCTTQAMWLVACISQFELLPPQQTNVGEK